MTNCKNCGQPIKQIVTTDGVGWYHPDPVRSSRVWEGCHPPAATPKAEPEE